MERGPGVERLTHEEDRGSRGKGPLRWHCAARFRVTRRPSSKALLSRSGAPSAASERALPKWGMSRDIRIEGWVPRSHNGESVHATRQEQVNARNEETQDHQAIRVSSLRRKPFSSRSRMAHRTANGIAVQLAATSTAQRV